jgi:hypothetical protein
MFLPLRSTGASHASLDDPDFSEDSSVLSKGAICLRKSFSSAVVSLGGFGFFLSGSDTNWTFVFLEDVLFFLIKWKDSSESLLSSSLSDNKTLRFTEAFFY